MNLRSPRSPPLPRAPVHLRLNLECEARDCEIVFKQPPRPESLDFSAAFAKRRINFGEQAEDGWNVQVGNSHAVSQHLVVLADISIEIILG